MTPFLRLFETVLSSEERANATAQASAERYFSIGHHGEGDDYGSDDRGSPDFCWAWEDGRLVVGGGMTHNMTFGHERMRHVRFKGWFDVDDAILSFVDDRERVSTPEEIPAQVYAHLKRRFPFKRVEVF